MNAEPRQIIFVRERIKHWWRFQLSRDGQTIAVAVSGITGCPDQNQARYGMADIVLLQSISLQSQVGVVVANVRFIRNDASDGDRLRPIIVESDVAVIKNRLAKSFLCPVC